MLIYFWSDWLPILFPFTVLEKDSHHNLNIKSSYLHLISDTVSSIGVLIGGVAIQLWGIVWIDPLITALISIYNYSGNLADHQKTVNILMQSAAPLNYEAIKTEIEKIKKVKNIHHVHTWMSDEDHLLWSPYWNGKYAIIRGLSSYRWNRAYARKKKGFIMLHCRQRLISVVINSCSNKNWLVKVGEDFWIFCTLCLMLVYYCWSHFITWPTRSSTASTFYVPKTRPNSSTTWRYTASSANSSTISPEDVLPKEGTGFRESLIWNKQAAGRGHLTAIINKLGNIRRPASSRIRSVWARRSPR